jgi:hypothetical protein
MTSMPFEFVASFRQSMPEAYRHQHTLDDVREHAQIVWRRGEELAHAEIWTKRMNVVVVCIVTDERPGLPSLIQATIAAHGLEVQAAQAYSRQKDQGPAEAVHLLWVRAIRHGVEAVALNAGDVSRLGDSLQALLRGETDLDTVIDRESVPPHPVERN